MVPFLLEPDYDLIGWDYMKPKRDRFAYVVDPKDGKYSSSRDGKSHNNIENDNSAAFNNTNLEKKDYKSSLADQLVAVTVDKNSATATNIGSLIIRESIYSRTGAKFLPEAIFTKDLYMREYALLMQLLETVRKDGIRLIHKCLLKYR